MKSTLVGYLIWFFLPQFGVHRMYLGDWSWGFAYLGFNALAWGTAVYGRMAENALAYEIGLGLIIFSFLWWLADGVRMAWMVEAANTAETERMPSIPIDGAGHSLSGVPQRPLREVNADGETVVARPWQTEPDPGSASAIYEPPPRPENRFDAETRGVVQPVRRRS